MSDSVTSRVSAGHHLSRITEGAEHEEHTSRVKGVTVPSVSTSVLIHWELLKTRSGEKKKRKKKTLLNIRKMQMIFSYGFLSKGQFDVAS